jgi:outer membrane protein OmpA-like peptidoglycan-associated protein
MKRKMLVFVAAVGLTVSASAHAQDWAGPEVGVQGSFDWGESSGHERTTGPSGPFHYKADTDGGMGGIHGGYNWQFGQTVLGLEGDVEGGEINGSEQAGNFDAGNGRKFHSDVDFDSSIRGKLGWSFGRALVYGTGGVAFGEVRNRYESTPNVIASCATPFNCGNSDTLRVGWTAGAGVAYAFTPNWSTDLEYRYTDLGSHGFTNANLRDSNEVNYSAIRLGITYRFAVPPMMMAPPPAPLPVAAPAPAPMVPPRTFIVFFDFDKSNLTADARKVIEAAAQSYKANGVARIEVSGYTDLAGTQAYNLRLSKRRAEAVAAYLDRLGVRRNVLDVKWFGKENPRVPTPDGVREPQNRRVEIVMPS